MSLRKGTESEMPVMLLGYWLFPNIMLEYVAPVEGASTTWVLFMYNVNSHAEGIM